MHKRTASRARGTLDGLVADREAWQFGVAVGGRRADAGLCRACIGFKERASDDRTVFSPVFKHAMKEA